MTTSALCLSGATDEYIAKDHSIIYNNPIPAITSIQGDFRKSIAFFMKILQSKRKNKES
jgi:hypothetical protein